MHSNELNTIMHQQMMHANIRYESISMLYHVLKHTINKTLKCCKCNRYIRENSFCIYYSYPECNKCMERDGWMQSWDYFSNHMHKSFRAYIKERGSYPLHEFLRIHT